jgi:hypothetical protein
MPTVETDHSNYIPAVESQAEIDNADKMETQSQSSTRPPDVMQAMMWLRTAKQRTAIANKECLSAEKAKDEAEREVEMLESILHP